MTSESSNPVLKKSFKDEGDIVARSTKILLDFMMTHPPLGTEFAPGALVGKKLGLTSYYQRNKSLAMRVAEDIARFEERVELADRNQIEKQRLALARLISRI